MRQGDIQVIQLYTDPQDFDRTHRRLGKSEVLYYQQLAKHLDKLIAFRGIRWTYPTYSDENLAVAIVKEGRDEDLWCFRKSRQGWLYSPHSCSYL